MMYVCSGSLTLLTIEHLFNLKVCRIICMYIRACVCYACLYVKYYMKVVKFVTQQVFVLYQPCTVEPI